MSTVLCILESTVLCLLMSTVLCVHLCTTTQHYVTALILCKKHIREKHVTITIIDGKMVQQH